MRYFRPGLRGHLPPQFFARTTPVPAGQPVKAVAAGEFRDTAKLGAVYD
jgi:hypothetical protein